MPPVPACPSVDACIWLADSGKDARHCIPFPASSPNLRHGLADKMPKRVPPCPDAGSRHSNDKAFHSERNLFPHRHESSGNLSLLRGGLSLSHPYAISPLLYINRGPSLHPTNEAFQAPCPSPPFYPHPPLHWQHGKATFPCHIVETPPRNRSQ